MDKSTTSGSVEGNGGIGNYTNTSQNQSMEKNMGERKNYKRAANRGKKGSRVLPDRSYSTARVLRSTSASKQSPSDAVVQPAAKKSPDNVHTSVQPAAMKAPNNKFSKIRQQGRPTNKTPNNEFSKIRQRVRYILNRMNYEQSLLEAYASEGWKRQSLEKIRPEKELERAKAEIVRCKLRIREAFQNLDCLLSVGKLEESLFDSEGEISSEDISCATCGLQNATLDNDIILCDGACDRGFHQKCLDPPLLTKDIPAGDEGWLCPACDCKIDCIDVINELQGTNLSLSDPWEKVFPEAAELAHGSKQNDVSDLPSDDSEDDDFDPDIAEEHVAGHKEGSSEEDGNNGSDSGDSNFITSSDNSEHLKDKKKVDDLGLPSEDSEDDDYDPAGPDSDKEIEEKQDDSDFTSDSDDFCAEISKSCGQDEVSSGAKSGGPTKDFEGVTFQIHTSIPNLSSKDLQMDQDGVLPVSGRRQVQRLDYKRLYDDAYGEETSDSSDDEEWSGKSTPEKDIDGGQRPDVRPESIHSYTTTSGLVGCLKGEFRENHEKNASPRYVGRPKDGSADDHILGLELEDEGSDCDDPNFVTSSDNSEPLVGKEKVDDLGLPSEDSEDDDYDPAGPDSDEDIEMKKSSSDESDFSSCSDDFCAKVAKSSGQDGVPSGAKPGRDSMNDLEGTTLQSNTAISDIPSKDLEIDQDVVLTVPSGAKAGGDPINDLEGIKLQANPTISNLPSKDPEVDQDAVLPVSGRRQKAYGEQSSDSSDGEDCSGKNIPKKDNGRQSEAGSFAHKSFRRTRTVHQSNESTPQGAQKILHCDAFHGSVNGQHAGEVLTPNGSNSTAQRRQFGPMIHQRLSGHFKTDQYPSRAVKESLAQELGLTLRQVSKWFETTRRNTRVAASKNGSHLENHSTNGNKSSVAAHIQITHAKEVMVEKLNVCKNVKEGIKHDSPQKADVGDGLRTHVTPPGSCQQHTTISGLAVCLKGESRESHGKNNSSRYAARTKDGYAEDVVLALEVVDEGAKKAALRDLKKRKMG